LGNKLTPDSASVAGRSQQIDFSLIVPTRGRTEQLRRFLDSIQGTAHRLARLEVILVIDEGDEESSSLQYDGVNLKNVRVPPRRSMGQLNMAGYLAAAGRYLMLLNDDVIVRTPGWDERMLAAFHSCPDEIALVHVNDLLFRETLCVFPCLTREFCLLTGGICKEGYLRYRIDDHIHNIFDLLSLLGHNRRIYLPDVVFEHTNVERTADGGAQYVLDPVIQEIDAKLFDSLLEERRQVALEAMRLIDNRLASEKQSAWRKRLDQVTDSIAIRLPEHARLFPTASTAGSGSTGPNKEELRGLWPDSLFDRDYYLAKNPDVVAAGLDPVVHFLEVGAKAGRNPSRLFDIKYYIAEHPEVVDSELNPLQHFVALGCTQGFKPNPLFDPAYYLAANPDVRASGKNPLAHFIEFGAKEGRWPNQLFDTAYYLQQNSDVLAAGLNPLAHFLEFGASEGRKPNAVFEPAYYLLQNPDVVTAGQNPLAHFLTVGAAEGRRPCALFDPIQYAALNPEVKETGINPLAHFLELANRSALQIGEPQDRQAAGAFGPATRRERPPIPLSVVIPTYNRGELLAATVQACHRHAGGCELEIIVVDDGSTDDTLQRLSELSAVIPNLTWRSCAKVGPGKARNIGAEAARHDVLIFLGDDIRPMNDDFFRIHASLHGKYNDNNLAVLGKVVWPDMEQPITYTMAHVQGEGAQQFGYVHLTPYSFVTWASFYTANVSVKKALVQDWIRNGFDEDFTGAAFEDLEFAYRFSKAPQGLKIFYDPAARASHHHQYTLPQFMDRQTHSGEALAHFIELHPETTADFNVRDIVDALRAPKSPGEDQLLVDHRALINGLKALAKAVEADGQLGSEHWHADFLSAVLDLCLVDGFVSAWPVQHGDLAAVTALMLDRFCLRMRRSLPRELADWSFLVKLVPQAAIGLLWSRHARSA
jgi:glycosyltransferase involved in cell wall biosynthesis